MLQTECGYTPTEIRAMTLMDVGRLNAHWQRTPPLRLLVAGVAAALGVQIPSQHKPENDSGSEKVLTGGALAALFPDGKIRIHGR